MRVVFHARYDHRWPSRAMTHFPAGYSGTVKREVGLAAIAKGRAREIRATPVRDAAAEAPEMARSGSLAVDDRADGGAAIAPRSDRADRGHGDSDGGPEARVLGDLDPTQ